MTCFHDITWHTEIKEKVSLEFWEQKKLACAILGKICYVGCTINRTGKFICLRACLHDRVGLIDKPVTEGSDPLFLHILTF